MVRMLFPLSAMKDGILPSSKSMTRSATSTAVSSVFCIPNSRIY
jgi:hypothetical protein